MYEQKQIEGWPEYEVDTNGDVWSVRRGANRKLRPMLQGKKSKQYRAVGLCRDGKQINRKVCHLVLETFVGPRPDGQECRHLSDNSLDDRLENLSWGSASQNMIDRSVNGSQNNQRLTVPDVRKIKQMLEDGYTCKEVAAFVGVSHWSIHDIKQGRTWSHIK